MAGGGPETLSKQFLIARSRNTTLETAFENGWDQGVRVGYARVSTMDQSPGLQLEALRQAGCERVYTERASGARDDRPELARVLGDVLRSGDTLVVWKLDRLARSLKTLIATAEELGRRIGGEPVTVRTIAFFSHELAAQNQLGRWRSV